MQLVIIFIHLKTCLRDVVEGHPTLSAPYLFAIDLQYRKNSGSTIFCAFFFSYLAVFAPTVANLGATLLLSMRFPLATLGVSLKHRLVNLSLRNSLTCKSFNYN